MYSSYIHMYAWTYIRTLVGCCIHVCTYVFMHTYICMYIHIRIYICTYVYVCMCVCIYVHVRVYPFHLGQFVLGMLSLTAVTGNSPFRAHPSCWAVDCTLFVILWFNSNP